MKINKVAIIGAVGTALNILEQIKNARDNFDYPLDPVGVIIDTFSKGELISEVPVIGGLKDLQTICKIKDLGFIYALFKPEILKERYILLKELNIPINRYLNFFHPLAYISSTIKFGHGNVVLSNSTIQAGITMGDFNIINSNVVIEHDTRIGNGNFFAAGSIIGAHVHVGNHCFTGLNSSIRENVILRNEVFVGMHSLVLENFSKCRVAGSPARII